MTALTAQLLTTVRRLIKNYGELVSFNRVVEGAFVPTTSAVGAGVTTGYNAYGVQQPTPNKEVNGTTVLQSDTVLWVEVSSFNYAPLVGDVATLGVKDYRVLAVTNTVLQGVTLLYKLQLRI